MGLVRRSRRAAVGALAVSVFVGCAGSVRSSEPVRYSHARGVLYSDQGGASGSATGEVALQTHSGLLRLSYNRPYPERGFHAAACRRVGALWEVDFNSRDAGIPALAAARCVGFSDKVRRVDEMVRVFFRAVGDGDDLAAAKLAGPAVSVHGLRTAYGISGAGTALAGSVGSTEIIRAEGNSVTIYAHLDRLVVAKETDFCCLVHVVKQAGIWRVEEVEGAPPP